MTGVRRAALLTGLLTAVMVSACGVPPSGVIEAGDPASGLRKAVAPPGAASTVFIYLLRDGSLLPVPRSISGDVTLAGVVGLLFDGPTIVETGEKTTTELPRLGPSPVIKADGRTVSVSLPGVGPLTHSAMQQLVCTVAAHYPQPSIRGGADLPGGAVVPPGQAAEPIEIRVTGSGWVMGQSASSCFPLPGLG